MRIREVMYPPVYVTPDTSILELAKLMDDHNIGVVVIERGEDGHGIVTERDILYKVVAEEKDPVKTTVEDIMTKGIHTIEVDKHFREATRLFNLHNIRRLLVTEGEKIRGIISSKDTARCSIFMYDEYVQLLADKTDEDHTKILRQEVTDIMRDVTKLTPDTSVLDAAKSMKEDNVGEAVTKDEGEHMILTEIDILYKVVANGLHPDEVKIKDISSPLQMNTTIESSRAVRDASSIFNVRNIRRLPVVENDEVIGIITEKNISKYLLFAYSETLHALEEMDPESAKSLEELEDKRMGIFVKDALKPEK